MKKRHVEEAVMLLLMRTSFVLVAFCLAFILFTVISKGLPALNWAMITQSPKGGYYLGKEAKRQPASSDRFPGFTGGVPLACDSICLAEGDKLAATASLGCLRYTGHFITRSGDRCRNTFWITGRPGLDHPPGWVPNQRVMVETHLALFAGCGRYSYHPVWVEIYLPRGRECPGLFPALPALYIDRFLGYRWSPMDIYSLEIG